MNGIDPLSPDQQTCLMLAILAHFLVDYLLQSPEMAGRKRTSFSTLLLHILQVAGMTLLMTLPFLHARWLGGVFLIAGFHLALDAVKVRVERIFRKAGAGLDAADQILHLCVIYAAVHMARPYPVYGLEVMEDLAALTGFGQADINRACVFGIALLFLAGGASSVIGVLLDRLHGREAPLGKTDGLDPTGHWMGVSERFAIFTLLATWSPLGAAGLLGIKLWVGAQTRQSERRDRFIVGTLLSGALAFGTWWAVQVYLRRAF